MLREQARTSATRLTIGAAKRRSGTFGEHALGVPFCNSCPGNYGGDFENKSRQFALPYNGLRLIRI
jgi:hypothetical protein